MKFQSELQKSKKIVRDWVRANFSDERLATVYAFNSDGKMSFRNPCGCLLGVTYSDSLHLGHDCNREHYWRARRQDLAQTRRFAALFPSSRIGKAERAYNFLGFSAAFSNCFGDDLVRRRRFSAILRAEMRRRSQRNVLALDGASERADFSLTAQSLAQSGIYSPTLH
jgi:hypothetical protein